MCVEIMFGLDESGAVTLKKRDVRVRTVFLFRQETAYGLRLNLVSSEVCIRGRP